MSKVFLLLINIVSNPIMANVRKWCWLLESSIKLNDSSTQQVQVNTAKDNKSDRYWKTVWLSVDLAAQSNYSEQQPIIINSNMTLELQHLEANKAVCFFTPEFLNVGWNARESVDSIHNSVFLYEFSAALHNLWDCMERIMMC